MPKIVKNNTVYAAVPSSASGIAYNGTTSGISANTVQGAIDEIASGVSYLRVVNGAVNIVYDDGTT